MQPRTDSWETRPRVQQVSGRDERFVRADEPMQPLCWSQALTEVTDIDKKVDFTWIESGKGTLVFPDTVTLGVLLSKSNMNAMVGSGSNFYYYKAVVLILFGHQPPS